MTPKYFFLAILAMLVLVSIASAADPYEGHVAASTTAEEPFTATFTDISYNIPTSYEWTKTDVTGANVPIVFSVVANPTHTFYQGNWSIQLKVTNAAGTNTTAANKVFFNITGEGAPPVADFTADKTSVTYGERIQFTDLSTNNPTSWSWGYCGAVICQDMLRLEYGVDEQNPNVVLPVGTWTIQLSATNAQGTGYTAKTNYITVSPLVVAPVANFTPLGSYADDNWIISVDVGTRINFTDISAGLPTTWNWTFQKNGGYVYSNEQNPFFIYDTANITSGNLYLVRLKASNSAGQSTITRYVFPGGNVPPIAMIWVRNTLGNPSDYYFDSGSPSYSNVSVPNNTRSLVFLDSSYNFPTSYEWRINAGNGTTYTRYTSWFEFIYTDAEEGYYSVQLNVSNDYGSDSLYFPSLAHVFDVTPPKSISGITNNSGSTAIMWNWTYPVSSGVSYVMVWKNGTLFENISYPQNGTLWTGLTPDTGYAIATKTVDAAGNVNATFVNSTAKTGVTQWTYYYTGTTQYWTCPVGVYEITLDIASAGGSGASSQLFIGSFQSAYGGQPGEFETISRVAVVPGTTYSIIVGKGGDAATYPVKSNAGTESRFFGGILSPIVKMGGIGGEWSNPPVVGNGTAGQNGHPLGTGNASWGTNITGHSGGAPGTGWGASGGGSAGEGAEGGSGGKGSDGIVRITVYGQTGANVPEFTADRTTGTPGTLIRFTDLSVIYDPNALVYNWSWGDNTYSSTRNPSHVFSYTGSYDVSLTLTSSNGTVTERKEAYINIVNVPPDSSVLTPAPVQFILIDKWGRALPGVNVTATMLSSSVDNTNWFATLFSLSEATPVNSTILYDTTDDTGSVVFLMVPVGRYRLDFIDDTRGISESREVHPSQSLYVYILTTDDTITAENKANYINITLDTYPPASAMPATVYLYGNYTDLSGTTTSATFFVRYSNQTAIYSTSTTASTLNAQYAVTNTAGAGYIWGIEAVTSQFGEASRAKGITLKGTGQYGLASNLIRTNCTSWECT